ncbi:hypothetical protein ACUNWD_17290 [Sunxiuqinia sp. A32]|uniref:hypothetical protein n=1 Tax=Sunxiuqinia sp. A32 TaxID=3461496 RepID=UPI0040455128
MAINSEIQAELENHKVDFVHFIDISQLAKEQNKGFASAILFGIVLSPAYLQEIINTPDFVARMIRNKQVQNDEFHKTELKTDRIADQLASFLIEKGYSAYSQSEDHIAKTGFYNENTKTTPLPHKTIALMAGIGWIGKHDLLVNPKFGSAISMCSVLTDAPLKTIRQPYSPPKCGDCKVCQEVCNSNAIHGTQWNIGKSRDDIVNVYKCTTCLRCLAVCPWTQAYAEKHMVV